MSVGVSRLPCFAMFSEPWYVSGLSLLIFCKREPVLRISRSKMKNRSRQTVLGRSTLLPILIHNCQQLKGLLTFCVAYISSHIYVSSLPRTLIPYPWFTPWPVIYLVLKGDTKQPRYITESLGFLGFRVVEKLIRACKSLATQSY